LGLFSFSASSGSEIGFSTSYFTSISLTASRAIDSVSATTPAKTSPTYLVSSPTSIIRGQSGIINPWNLLPGISFAVNTFITPFNRSALVMLIDIIFARG